jgi:hypothetical protein
MKPCRLAHSLGLSILLAATFVVPGRGQSHFPAPPEAADKQNTLGDSKPAPHPPRIDALQLQREARELLELAQTIPVDMQHVNQGLLPKDTVEKLKRIEKLSKHLRGELHP